jgi:hypothetical protein
MVANLRPKCDENASNLHRFAGKRWPGFEIRAMVFCLLTMSVAQRGVILCKLALHERVVNEGNGWVTVIRGAWTDAGPSLSHLNVRRSLLLHPCAIVPRMNGAPELWLGHPPRTLFCQGSFLCEEWVVFSRTMAVMMPNAIPEAPISAACASRIGPGMN